MTQEPSPVVTEEPFRVPVLNLLRLAVPAVIVGIVSALTLLGLSRLAGLLEHWIWDDLSAAVGLTSDSALWIIGVLTATGLLIGLVVRYVPGHAGPDPATLELVAEPLPLRVLPGLALALVLMLAGGVSLGPENPIIGINVGLAVGIGMRFLPKVKAPIWLMMAVAGTIGAMFGTPVAAALLFSELDPGDRRVPLWDRLFPPLVAATAGSLTMMQLEDLDLAVDVPAYTYGGLDDLGLAIAIAVGSAAARPGRGLPVRADAPAVPTDRPPGAHAHHRRPDPGSARRARRRGDAVQGPHADAGAARAGRDDDRARLPGDGRHQAAGDARRRHVRVPRRPHLPGAVRRRRARVRDPPGLVTRCRSRSPSAPRCVGIVVAATRNGWLSIFMAVAVVPQVTLLIPVVLATLAAWLIVTNRPALVAPADPRTGTGCLATP